MGYAESYGKKGLWRARYLMPNGKLGSQPRFTSKTKAKKWADEQESKVRNGKFIDPKKAQTKVKVWVAKWWEAQDLAESTMAKYRWDLDTLILPFWGEWELGDIEAIDIARWQKKLRAHGYGHNTLITSHSRLHTILEDAVDNKYIPTNPATRKRKRGQDDGAAAATEESLWATPLQLLLVAERCAIISGRDQDFVMPIGAGWSGTTWSETTGLEKPYCRTRLHRLIRIEWHSVEVGTRWYRRQPKVSRRRDIVEPPFLVGLLNGQLQSTTKNRCACDHQAHPNEFVYLGPQKGHLRRGNYADRILRPAADGVYPARGKDSGMVARDARPVLVDMAAGWPGKKAAASWPYAVPGQDWVTPSGKGRVRLDDGAGLPRVGMELASWLPIVPGLTFHDLRHSQKVWLIEAGVPEIAQAERLGHRIGGVRGIYSHVSEPMRVHIVEVLQQLWDEALAARFAMCPTSPVPVLDALLEPLREAATKADGEESAPTDSPSAEKISTISPLRGSDRRVSGGH